MSLDWYHSSEDEDYVPCEVLSDESASSEEEEVIPEEESAGPAQPPVKGKRKAFKRAMEDIRRENAKAAKKKPTKQSKQAPSKK